MSRISAEGYKNAGVHLIIKETGELWVSIKDVGDGLGVKNISALALKEMQGIYGKKIWKKKKENAIKWLKGKYLKSLIN